MSTVAIKGKRAEYTPAQIDEGLGAMVLCGGSEQVARKELARRGVDIPSPTLQSWKRVHAQRYAEISRELLPKLEEQMLQQLAETVRQAQNATQAAVALSHEQIKAKDVKDPAGTARNLATVSAIAVDKISEITGRPKVVEHRHSTDELWAELQRLAPGAFIDGEATELKPMQRTAIAKAEPTPSVPDISR